MIMIDFPKIKYYKYFVMLFYEKKEYFFEAHIIKFVSQRTFPLCAVY